MDDEAGKAFSPLVTRYVLLIMAVICLGAAVAAKPAILALFGRDFSRSLTPMILLLPGVLALSLYDFLKTDVLGLGRPGFISLVSVLAMAVNLALNVLLIPAHGPAGAALASSAAYACPAPALWSSWPKDRNPATDHDHPLPADLAFVAGRIGSIISRRKSDVRAAIVFRSRTRPRVCPNWPPPCAPRPGPGTASSSWTPAPTTPPRTSCAPRPPKTPG
jgi:hypothetical protein